MGLTNLEKIMSLVDVKDRYAPVQTASAGEVDSSADWVPDDESDDLSDGVKQQEFKSFSEGRISLYAFCKKNGLPKTSVHRRCRELGIDTSAGLDSASQNWLLADLDLIPSESKAGDNDVDHPPHYQGSIECIDAIAAALTPDELAGFIKGNVIKYTWRSLHKGGNKDLEKAKWYLNWYLEHQNELSSSDTQ
jgi:Protein of unknwon function (DUF3310)